MHVGGVTLVGRQREVPFLEFVDRLPELTRNVGDGDAQAKPRSKKQTLLEQFPWLRDYEKKLDFFASSDKTKKPRARADDDSGSDGASELCDDEVDAALDALHLARAELLAETADADCADFRPHVLGGKWTAQFLHKPFDAISGMARNGEAEAFSERRIGQKTMRFSVTYGTKECGILARAYCHRLQYFYDVENLFDGHLHVFTNEQRAAYVESAEFLGLAAVTKSAAVLGRISQVRRMCA
jgi:hypothetical protein